MSTLEAEFIALASVMRDLIPARLTLQGISKSLGLSVPEGANLKSMVFEDNNGCMTLATTPKMTPHTEYVGVKQFWFCSDCGSSTGINIVKVDIKEQLADTFTNGIGVEPFTHLRQKLMGWASEV
jgi:hypothetical protein